MKNYTITFTRENGTTGSDHFTAATEAQARKDFREVYRHGNPTIVSIELDSESVSATKDQELAALKQIEKLVRSLGPDSYLAAAFEGCFDLARDNIGNDWACSMADRARKAEARVAELDEKLQAAMTENLTLRESQKSLQDANDNRFHELMESSSRTERAETRAKAAEGEVIRLKAKLYDLLVAQKEV